MINYSAPHSPDPNQQNRWFQGFSTGWQQLAEVADDRNQKTDLALKQQSLSLEARRIALQDKQIRLQHSLGIAGLNLDSKKLTIAQNQHRDDYNLKSKNLSLVDRMQQFEMGNALREIQNAEAGAKAATQFAAMLAPALKERNITPKPITIQNPTQVKERGLKTGADMLNTKSTPAKPKVDTTATPKVDFKKLGATIPTREVDLSWIDPSWENPDWAALGASIPLREPRL
jgi:hypothetical protein